jgi:bacillolysin
MMKIQNSLLLLGLLLSPNFALVTANASEAGKIYLNGEWISARVALPKFNNTQTNALMSGITGQGSAATMDLRKLALQFLNDNGEALHWNSASAWQLPTVQNGSALETHRIAKTWHGMPVIGGESLVHFSKGNFLFASADNTELGSISPTPRLIATEARDLAFASYSGSAVSTEAPKLEVLILSASPAREARLVYEVTVRDRDTFSSDVHFIDANRGDEVMVQSNVHTVAAPRVVVAAAGDETDFDFDTSKWTALYAGSQSGCTAPITSSVSGWLSSWWSAKPAAEAIADDGNPATCETVDARVMASGMAAWNNSGMVHSFYQTTFKRNSIDDRGMQIKSIVNFGGVKFPNAAWFNDKKIMLYGNGDPSKYNDFALPLDVAGHEMTHGITASTANLAYEAEPGALNESYSDVFGKLIAFKNGRGSDWKIGRELFRDGVGFVRDMENPEIGNTANFKYRGQLCHRFNDFCGVHANSGIPSRAAVIMAKKLGLEKLGKLYYLTLTQLLRSNSSFADARAQTEAACSTLFGASSEDCRTVSSAYQAVGI